MVTLKIVKVKFVLLIPLVVENKHENMCVLWCDRTKKYSNILFYVINI